MTTVLDARGLGKQYGRRWALRDCTLAIPEGKLVGLVGPNGAGKTTLLHLAVGLLGPTTGALTVLGGRPADGPARLGRVGFVAQDTPVYARLSVAGHLRMGGQFSDRHEPFDASELVFRVTDMSVTLTGRPCGSAGEWFGPGGLSCFAPQRQVSEYLAGWLCLS